MRTLRHTVKIAPAAAALFCCAVGMAGAAEYLKADRPIPASLTERAGVIDELGVVPEQRLAERVLFPALRLQRLRAGLADTGSPFIDDAVFSLAPRSYYRHLDFGGGVVAEEFAIGGALGLETGWLAERVRFGFTGHSSIGLYTPEGREGTGLLRDGGKEYTVLSQAYAEFRAERTFLTIGRQRLDGPFINADDHRMTPNTFEGVMLRSASLEPLMFVGGHVSKIKFRNSSTFDPLSAQAGAPDVDRGVTAAGLRWSPSDDFQIGAVNQYGWDMFNTFYAEAEGAIAFGDDWSLKIGSQFTDQRSVGDQILGEFESQSVGGRVSLGFRSLIATTAFTWTGRGSSIRSPWGGDPSYNSLMLNDFTRAGERSARLGLSYSFDKLGLQGLAFQTNFAYGNTPDSGAGASPDQREVDFTLDYQPPVELLENFWLRVRYAVNDRSDDTERKDLRLILNYSFLF